MFWTALIGSIIVAILFSLIGGVLIQVFRDRFPAAHFLGYLAIGLGALLLLSSPFTLASRYEATETLSAAESGCSSHKYEARGVSPAGITLFTWSTTTDWCYDGSLITDAPFLMLEISSTALFWRFDGYRSNYEHGGEDEHSHKDFVQGAFSYCPPLTGCIQHLYPRISKQQLGDGNASASMGKDSFNQLTRP